MHTFRCLFYFAIQQDVCILFLFIWQSIFFYSILSYKFTLSKCISIAFKECSSLSIFIFINKPQNTSTEDTIRINISYNYIFTNVSVAITILISYWSYTVQNNMPFQQAINIIHCSISACHFCLSSSVKLIIEYHTPHTACFLQYHSF